MTQKEAIMQALTENPGGLSAVDTTKQVNSRLAVAAKTHTTTASVSSSLKKMVEAGEITRLAGMSKRGGFLYLIDAKVQH